MKKRNGVRNDDADTEKEKNRKYNTMKWKMHESVVYSVHCCWFSIEVFDVGGEPRTSTTTDALEFTSPEKLLRMSFN